MTPAEERHATVGDSISVVQSIPDHEGLRSCPHPFDRLYRRGGRIVCDACGHVDERLTARPLPAMPPTTEPRTEPTLDELWEAVAASLAVAEEHKTAIYRSGDGVPGPEALAGIQKHIQAGLAARVMYSRLAALEGLAERVRGLPRYRVNTVPEGRPLLVDEYGLWLERRAVLALFSAEGSGK